MTDVTSPTTPERSYNRYLQDAAGDDDDDMRPLDMSGSTTELLPVVTPRNVTARVSPQPTETRSFATEARSFVNGLLSPFSPLLKQREQRDEYLQYVSLKPCRKVSVVVRVLPTDDEAERCVFPHIKGEPQASIIRRPQKSPRDMIVVNPDAFGEKVPRKVTMDTARLVAQVSQISSEDWARLYEFHHVMWPFPSTEESSPGDQFSTMDSLSRAVTQDALVEHQSSLVISMGQASSCMGIEDGLWPKIISHCQALIEDKGVATLSMFEISEDKEQFRDLLRRKNKDVSIRHVDMNGAVLQGLTQLPIDSVPALLESLSKRKKSNSTVIGTLSLWDNAVSHEVNKAPSAQITCVELAHEDNGRKLGDSIVYHKSTVSLGLALRQLLLHASIGSEPTISYRESTLTKVLQRSLESSKIVLLASVSQLSDDYNSTVVTLNYLRRLLVQPGKMASSPFKDEKENANSTTTPSKLQAYADDEHLLESLVADPRQRLAKIFKNTPPRKKATPLEFVPSQDEYEPVDYMQGLDSTQPQRLELSTPIAKEKQVNEVTGLSALYDAGVGHIDPIQNTHWDSREEDSGENFYANEERRTGEEGQAQKYSSDEGYYSDELYDNHFQYDEEWAHEEHGAEYDEIHQPEEEGEENYQEFYDTPNQGSQKQEDDIMWPEGSPVSGQARSQDVHEKDNQMNHKEDDNGDAWDQEGPIGAEREEQAGNDHHWQQLEDTDHQDWNEGAKQNEVWYETDLLSLDSVDDGQSMAQEESKSSLEQSNDEEGEGKKSTENITSTWSDWNAENVEDSSIDLAPQTEHEPGQGNNESLSSELSDYWNDLRSSQHFANLAHLPTTELQGGSISRPKLSESDTKNEGKMDDSAERLSHREASFTNIEGKRGSLDSFNNSNSEHTGSKAILDPKQSFRHPDAPSAEPRIAKGFLDPPEVKEKVLKSHYDAEGTGDDVAVDSKGFFGEIEILEEAVNQIQYMNSGVWKSGALSLHRVKESLRSQQRGMAELAQERDELKSAVASLKDEMKVSSDGHDAQLHHYEEEVLQLQDRLQSALDDKIALEKVADEAVSQQGNLERSLKVLRENLSEDNHQNEARKQEYESLLKTRDELGENLSELKRERNQLDDERKKGERINVELKQSVKRLEDEMSILKRKCIADESTIEEFKTQVRELEISRQALEKNRSHLEALRLEDRSDLEGLKIQSTRFGLSLENAEKERLRLEELRRKDQNSMDQLRSELQSTKSSCERLEMELEQSEKRRNESNRALNEVETECLDLTSSVKSLKMERDHFKNLKRANSEEIESEIRRLRLSVTDMQNECKRLTQARRQDSATISRLESDLQREVSRRLDHEKLEGELSRIKKENGEMESLMAKQKSDYVEETKQREAEALRLKASFDELAQEVVSYRERESEKSQQADGEIRQLKESLEEYKSELSLCRRQRDEFGIKIESIEDELRTYSHHMKEKDEKIELYCLETKHAKKELSLALEREKSNATDAEKNNASLEKRNLDLEADLALTKRQRDEAQALAQFETSKKQALSEEVNRVRAQLNSQKAETESLLHDLKRTKSDKGRGDDRIAKMEVALHRFQSETKEKVGKVMNHHKDSTELLEKARNEYRALEKDKMELERTVNKLQHERDSCFRSLEIGCERLATIVRSSNDRISGELHFDGSYDMKSPDLGSHIPELYLTGHPSDRHFSLRAEEITAYLALSARNSLQERQDEASHLRSQVFRLEEEKETEVASLRARIRSLKREVMHWESVGGNRRVHDRF